MSDVRPTMKTIAREAGVSVMTVSLALRNHPRISGRTREHIRHIADRLGYRPNPMVASLMTHIRSSRAVPYQATLAFLADSDTPAGWKRHPFARTAYEGICERAEALGFLVEPFPIGHSGMPAGRIERVLRSRNIQGVVLSPLPEPGRFDHLDWSQWSAVALGNSLLSPRIHRVTHHQYHGMSLIFETLRRKGYRRIGLAIDELSDDKVDRTFTSSIAGAQLRIPARERVPILLAKLDPQPVSAWLEKTKPDAVIGHDGLLFCLRQLGVDVFKDLAFAHVNLPSEISPRFSGLNQNWKIAGAAAVDSVVAEIHRNERGIPAHPRTVMIEGEWIEGCTTLKEDNA